VVLGWPGHYVNSSVSWRIARALEQGCTAGWADGNSLAGAMAEMEELELSVQEAAAAAEVEAPIEAEEMPAVPWPDTEVQGEEVMLKTEEPQPEESAVVAATEVEKANEPAVVATGEREEPFPLRWSQFFPTLQTGFRSCCTCVSSEHAHCACLFWKVHSAMLQTPVLPARFCGEPPRSTQVLACVHFERTLTLCVFI
jgi:hypothetical protein